MSGKQLRVIGLLLGLGLLLGGCDTLDEIRTDPRVTQIEDAEFYNALQDTVVDVQLPILVLGLVNLMAGWKLRRIGLVINGFAIGGLMIYTFLLNADLGADDNVLVAAGLAGGIIIGILAFFLYNLMALVIGGLIGTTLMGGAWLQVAENVPPQVLVFATTFISAMVMFVVFRLFLVAFSAVIGAGLLMLGVPFEPVWAIPVAILGVLIQTGIAWSIKDDIFDNLRGDLGAAVLESFAEILGPAMLLRERQRGDSAPVYRGGPSSRSAQAAEPKPKSPPKPSQQKPTPKPTSAKPATPRPQAPPASYNPPAQGYNPPAYNPPPQQPPAYNPPQPASPNYPPTPPREQPTPPNPAYQNPPAMPQTPNVPPLDPHPPVPYQQSVPAPPPPSSLEQTQQNPRYRPENMLLVLSDGRQMPVRETQMVVGRHPESDIVVNDPEVSARHMIFSAQPEGIVVWDDNSTNGTFVNGERLVGSRRLGVGDTVRIGDITMQLREAPPPAE